MISYLSHSTTISSTTINQSKNHQFFIFRFSRLPISKFGISYSLLEQKRFFLRWWEMVMMVDETWNIITIFIFFPTINHLIFSSSFSHFRIFEIPSENEVLNFLLTLFERNQVREKNDEKWDGWWMVVGGKWWDE